MCACVAAKLESPEAWKLMLQYLFEPKHPLRSEPFAQKLAAARLVSLQDCEQQGTWGLGMLGLTMADAESLLSASNQSTCPSAYHLCSG